MRIRVGNDRRPRLLRHMRLPVFRHPLVRLADVGGVDWLFVPLRFERGKPRQIASRVARRSGSGKSAWSPAKVECELVRQANAA